MINNYNVALKKGLEEINYKGNSSIINKLSPIQCLFNNINSTFSLYSTYKTIIQIISIR